MAITIIFLFASITTTTSLSAKCFSFNKAKDVKVCVPGNDNKARGQAMAACKKAQKSDCGNITGYSGSCQSGKDKCLDGNGNSQKKISVD
ncbi:hypothetical protein [Leptospira sp. GIMC2001]|uniref:hypothetical protein n=1 Tax=Leptospira sp. GIMC2001 TaxID=1513297 RepID=UPI002348F5AB|nr:hypothetical protein [Leptospira sp. GIMC2001]WCL47728.1 hypothetical protein O4O04_00290 [Leptospira sp. GIMC2001]